MANKTYIVKDKEKAIAFFKWLSERKKEMDKKYSKLGKLPIKL